MKRTTTKEFVSARRLDSLAVADLRLGAERAESWPARSCPPRIP